MAHDNVKLTHGHSGSSYLWVGESHEFTPIALVPWDTESARENARDNAARICLTWNCHDDLVAALKSVEYLMTELGAKGEPLKTVRAALAKAGVK